MILLVLLAHVLVLLLMLWLLVAAAMVAVMAMVAVTVLEVPRATALRMAITVPATLMGLPDLARIQRRALSDLICLDESMGLLGFAQDL